MVSSVSALLGFLITFLLGFVFIPYLKKLNFGQTILEIGPAWHKDKQGTPIMGGLMFITGTIIATIIGFAIAYFTFGTGEKFITLSHWKQNPSRMSMGTILWKSDTHMLIPCL